MAADGASTVSDVERSSDYHLLIRNELRLVGDVRLAGEAIRLGSSPACNVRLDHPDVSPIHARIERRGAEWRLFEEPGAHGVRLNGRKVQEAALVPGDVIDIRPFSINVLRATDAADSPSDDRSLQLSTQGSVATYVRDPRGPDMVIRQRLEDLYAIARLVLGRKDNGTFWQTMHVALQRCLAADRCVVVGVDEQGRPYRLAPRARSSPGEAPLGMSRSVFRDAVDAGKAMLIEQVQSDARYAAAQSLVDHRSGSVICVPVVVEGRTRAVVYADRQLSRLAFELSDLDFAVAAVDLAATAVSLDELQARTRELARLRGRIDVGREMQKMLLPNPLPQPAWGEVAALNEPADQMSGDIYDVLLDSQGRLVVSLADVSGKGVPAAFGTAILQSALRQAVQAEDDLRRIVRAVNAAFERSSPADCFATMIICRWARDGQQVEIANAGHHAPLWLRRGGGVDAFPERVGIPLGVVPDWPDAALARDAREDLAVVLTSDGLTECASAEGIQYGLARAAQTLGGCERTDALGIANALVEDARAFAGHAPPHDDVTIVVVKRRVD